MKTILLLTFALISTSAFAQNKVICEVVDGQFENSMLQAKEISFETDNQNPGRFSLMDAEKLNINVFGKNEVFNRNQIAVTGGSFWDKGSTQMDYTLASNNSVKAVVLVDRNPGKAFRSKKFKGLVVITNTNIRVAADGGTPWFSAQSLVYNIKCRVK